MIAVVSLVAFFLMEDVQGWQASKWGMSKPELMALFPGSESAAEATGRRVTIPPVNISHYDFEVHERSARSPSPIPYRALVDTPPVTR
jgi:hypothetical protein